MNTMIKVYVIARDGIVEVYCDTPLDVVVIDIDDQAEYDPEYPEDGPIQVFEKLSEDPKNLLKDVTAMATNIDPPELVQDIIAELGVTL